MGCIAVKLLDILLFTFYLLITIFAPLLDAQSIFPLEFYPKQLVDLKQWYAQTYGDYLVVNKPSFFIGLVWLELVALWPLCILSLFAMILGKSWYKKLCLMIGASITTSLCAILSELTLSGKASNQLLMFYYPYLGLAVLAVLRGLLPSDGASTSSHVISKVSARKKRA